jgi:hypothetical protein
MIKNWSELNAMLPKLTEQEAEALLHEEMDGRKRRTFALRLHQRYCTLRAARERAELINAVENRIGVQIDNAEAMHKMPSSQAAY